MTKILERSKEKRSISDDDDLVQNSSKRAKGVSLISNDSINKAWAHYRAFLDSQEEVAEDEAVNIDELHEIIEILSENVRIQQVEISIETLPKCCLTTKSFGSIMSLLNALLSMVHLHIGNDLISQGFVNEIDEKSDHESNPLMHLEKSLMYFPFNPSALSILANYKRMNLNDTPENICTLYEQASVNAYYLRDLAISILDDNSEKLDDIYKEWVELLLLDGMCGVEYIGDDDDEDEEDEEDQVLDEENERNDAMNDDKQQSEEYSTSDVESVSSFMAAMLHSTLGRHDKAMKHLHKFNVSHRIHPNVWEYSMGSSVDKIIDTDGDNIIKLDFEPRVLKGKILPDKLYRRLSDIFGPNSAYWKESSYQNRGYYSFFTDLTADIISSPSNIIEDVVVNYLLPMVKNERPVEAAKIVGYEWWTHTRPLSANLGHQLHFDTDEALLDQKKELTHPIVSSVLYLTGNKNCSYQTAGSTIVFDQVPNSTEVASKAYVCHALDNSYMIFPGNSLHGVLPCPAGSDRSHSSDQVCDRLTLMVGFWTRSVPKNIKDQQLYSPCGPLPPATDDHTWVKEIKATYPKEQTSRNESQCQFNSSYESTTLPFVKPAWQIIKNNGNDKNDGQYLSIPCSLDHRFFVLGAPTCFRDSLFKDESFS